MNKTEAQAAAKAAWQSAYDFLDAKDAGVDALEGDDLAQWNDLYFAAKQADDAFGKAIIAEGGKTTAMERLDFYSRAIAGKGVDFQPIGTFEKSTLGRSFVESDGYKELVKSGALQSERQSFRTAGVTEQKAASDLIDTVAAGPAASLVLPDYIPGILPYGQRELTVRSLFSSGSTNSDIVSYARQTGFDSGAAPVAQATAVNGTGLTGGVKPQSSVAWSRETSPVSTIATWMVTTRQALMDAPQIEALINNQGRLMLQLEEEDQLLNGDGNDPNLEGLLTVPTVQTLNLTGEDNLDGVRTAIRMVKVGSAKARADGIIVNPIDAEELDLLKDANGLYRGGNPIGNFTFGQTVWRLNRVESEAVAEGKAVVGAFKYGATVLERQPITVYTADQHSDFFIRNLIVLLFEERLAFPVFFPTAFVEITLGDWPATGS